MLIPFSEPSSYQKGGMRPFKIIELFAGPRHSLPDGTSVLRNMVQGVEIGGVGGMSSEGGLQAGCI